MRLLSLMSFAVLLVACAGGGPPPPGEEPPVDDDDDDAGVDDDDTPGPGVVWRDAPGEEWSCTGPSIFCVDDYLALAAILAPEGLDMEACQDQLLLDLEELTGNPPASVEETATAEELSVSLREALAMDWLLDGLDERSLDVALVETVAAADVVEQHVLVTDPWVGTMKLRLLWPVGVVEPAPAVIGLPGHPNTDSVDVEFLEEHHGRAFAEAGFLVAVNLNRAYDGWYAESAAASALLCAGWSLLALRHYEILLLDKLLRSMQADGGVGSIFLVGHSGGSIAANALVRHVWSFDGLVTDLESTYLGGAPCDEEPGSAWCVVDETHPEVYPLHPQINDTGLVPYALPVLQQDYGYPDGAGAAIAFLQELAEG